MSLSLGKHIFENFERCNWNSSFCQLLLQFGKFTGNKDLFITRTPCLKRGSQHSQNIIQIKLAKHFVNPQILLLKVLVVKRWREICTNLSPDFGYTYSQTKSLIRPWQQLKTQTSCIGKDVAEFCFTVKISIILWRQR